MRAPGPTGTRCTRCEGLLLTRGDDSPCNFYVAPKSDDEDIGGNGASASASNIASDSLSGARSPTPQVESSGPYHLSSAPARTRLPDARAVPPSTLQELDPGGLSAPWPSYAPSPQLMSVPRDSHSLLGIPVPGMPAVPWPIENSDRSSPASAEAALAIVWPAHSPLWTNAAVWTATADVQQPNLATLPAHSDGSRDMLGAGSAYMEQQDKTTFFPQPPRWS